MSQFMDSAVKDDRFSKVHRKIFFGDGREDGRKIEKSNFVSEGEGGKDGKNHAHSYFTSLINNC